MATSPMEFLEAGEADPLLAARMIRDPTAMTSMPVAVTQAINTPKPHQSTAGTSGGPVSPSWRQGYEQRRRVENFRAQQYNTFLDIRSSDVADVPPVDNPTTIALNVCKKMVLRPYLRLLRGIGWYPLFTDPEKPWQQCVNIGWVVIVVALIFLGYIIQFAGCFRRDRAIASNSFAMVNLSGPNATYNGTVSPIPLPVEISCTKYLISQYIIPDLLHSIAYFYCLYYMRISDTEQLVTLMERVFLQSTETHTGYLSQKNLIQRLRLILWTGFMWVVFSLVVVVLQILAQFDEIDFTWLYPRDLTGKIFLYIFMVMGLLVLDIVYVAVVTNYSVQCALIIFYIRGLKVKVMEKIIDLQQSIKCIQETEHHLKKLNDSNATAVSIVTFNFLTMVVLGADAFLDKDHNGFTPLMYLTTGLNLFTWFWIMSIPLLQAVLVTAACNSLRKLGHEVRARPFVYQDSDRDELDSFLMYTSTLNMRAKIFKIPMRSSYICGLVVLVCFVILVLFQLGVISIWLVK
ncbi:unnamed protein product [Owenia fusiformis]|uniref:Uncharacterized protein n=1 Tax=Owenia fusiformis TaxID=6347 RepID=A0A8J1TCH9_OWEFU|nr:unnamed protein product [Owenia fusiformis]